MNQPQRTCVGCRQVDDRGALQRFVIVEQPDGSAVLRADPAASAPGRGAWLHDDRTCRELALRRGGFARSFRRRVDVAAVDLDWAAETDPR